jgi:[protein-PII] uridylyltransferase
VGTFIQVDNEASAHYTVVEVFTADRLGVLFKITYTLHQLGLSIHVAKISTNVDQVADVFFVTTAEGDKVEDSARIEAISQTLYACLVPDDERIAAPLH